MFGFRDQIAKLKMEGSASASAFNRGYLVKIEK
jgi:hypothetical protein